MRHALADGAPQADCKPITGLKLIGGGAVVADLYKEIRYVAESAQNHLEVAKDVWKALTNINPKYTAENLAKALNDEAKAVSKDFQHALDDAASVATNLPGAVNKQIENQKKNPGRPPDPVGGVLYDAGKKILRSDARLKDEVAKVGNLPNGIGLYRFRYLGTDQLYVGVLAQEVQSVMPNAVSQAADGHLLVNYGMLGIEMLTWHDWLKNRLTSPIEPGIPRHDAR